MFRNQPKEGCGVFGDLFFGKKAEKKKITKANSTEHEDKPKKGHKKDILGRANIIRKGRQG